MISVYKRRYFIFMFLLLLGMSWSNDKLEIFWSYESPTSYLPFVNLALSPTGVANLIYAYKLLPNGHILVFTEPGNNFFNNRYIQYYDYIANKQLWSKVFDIKYSVEEVGPYRINTIAFDSDKFIVFDEHLMNESNYYQIIDVNNGNVLHTAEMAKDYADSVIVEVFNFNNYIYRIPKEKRISEFEKISLDKINSSLITINSSDYVDIQKIFGVLMLVNSSGDISVATKNVESVAYSYTNVIRDLPQTRRLNARILSNQSGSAAFYFYGSKKGPIYLYENKEGRLAYSYIPEPTDDIDYYNRFFVGDYLFVPYQQKAYSITKRQWIDIKLDKNIWTMGEYKEYIYYAVNNELFFVSKETLKILYKLDIGAVKSRSWRDYSMEVLEGGAYELIEYYPDRDFFVYFDRTGVIKIFRVKDIEINK